MEKVCQSLTDYTESDLL